MRKLVNDNKILYQAVNLKHKIILLIVFINSCSMCHLVDKHCVSYSFKIFSMVILGFWLNNSVYYRKPYHAPLESLYLTKTRLLSSSSTYLSKSRLCKRICSQGNFVGKNIHLMFYSVHYIITLGYVKELLSRGSSGLPLSFRI